MALLCLGLNTRGTRGSLSNAVDSHGSGFIAVAWRRATNSFAGRSGFRARMAACRIGPRENVMSATDGEAGLAALPDPAAGSPALPPPLPSAMPEPPATHYRPMTPWGPWLALGATLLIGVAVVAFLAVTGLLLTAVLPNAFDKTALSVPKPHFDIPSVAYGFSAIMFASQLAGILLTLVFAGARGGRIAGVLALRAPIGGAWSYAWAVPVFVVYGFGLGALVQWLWPQTSQADIEQIMLLAHSPAAWLIFIIAAVMAPLQEELVFRGFLFSALANSRWLGFLGATVLTSLGWAAIHGYSIAGDATIFLLGLALCAILWRTGSTRVTMACHGVYNALAFLAAAVSAGGGA